MVDKPEHTESRTKSVRIQQSHQPTPTGLVIRHTHYAIKTFIAYLYTQVVQSELDDRTTERPHQELKCPAIGIDVWSTLDDHKRHFEPSKPWKPSKNCVMVVYTRVDTLDAYFTPTVFPSDAAQALVVDILNKCTSKNLVTICLRPTNGSDPHPTRKKARIGKKTTPKVDASKGALLS
jgi:hypothetical protein